MRLYALVIGLACAWLTSMPAQSPIPLEEAAAKFRDKLKKGCLVTAESVDGRTTYSLTGAPGTGDTPPGRIIFEIGSISKVFTGLLLADAVLRNKITLDTTLREAMGKKQKFADPGVAAITLRQLVTHTSGLPRLPENLVLKEPPLDPYAKYDRTMLDAAIAAQKLKGKPPYEHSYSNYGMALVGDLLARMEGRTWEELVKARITDPLEMRETTVTLNDEEKKRCAPGHNGDKELPPWNFGAFAGAGALRSTASDIIKFGEAILNPGKTPLKEAIELMLRPQTDDGMIGMAIMFDKVDGQAVEWHNGGTGGYRSMFQVIPETRTVRVILSSNTAVEPTAILAAARNEKPRTKASDKMLTREQLDEYAGVYPISPQVRFTVTRRGDHLWTQLTGQTFLELFPHETPDRFFLKVVAAEIQFHREGGKVVSMTNHQNGRELTAKRGAEPMPKIIFRSAAELAEFAGTYEMKPGVEFTLKVRDETLFARLTGQPPSPVFERRKDWFEFDVVEAALEFERDKNGKVVALKLHQFGIEQRAAKKAAVAKS